MIPDTSDYRETVVCLLFMLKRKYCVDQDNARKLGRSSIHITPSSFAGGEYDMSVCVLVYNNLSQFGLLYSSKVGFGFFSSKLYFPFKIVR